MASNFGLHACSINWLAVTYKICIHLPRAWKVPETAEEKAQKAKDRAEKIKAKKEKKRKDDVKSEMYDSDDSDEPKLLD